MRHMRSPGALLAIALTICLQGCENPLEKEDPEWVAPASFSGTWVGGMETIILVQNGSNVRGTTGSGMFKDELTGTYDAASGILVLNDYLQGRLSVRETFRFLNSDTMVQVRHEGFSPVSTSDYGADGMRYYRRDIQWNN